MPLYWGRSNASRFFSGPIEYGQLIRSAITGPGIVGHSCSRARIWGSNASTTDPLAARSHFGGRSEFNAARTVFRATPNRREISLMGTPSARCRRRISANSSTFSTLHGQEGGSVFGIPPRVSLQRTATQVGPVDAARAREADRPAATAIEDVRSWSSPTGREPPTRRVWTVLGCDSWPAYALAEVGLGPLGAVRARRGCSATPVTSPEHGVSRPGRAVGAAR